MVYAIQVSWQFATRIRTEEFITMDGHLNVKVPYTVIYIYIYIHIYIHTHTHTHVYLIVRRVLCECLSQNICSTAFWLLHCPILSLLVGSTSRFVCVVRTFSLCLVCDSVSVWADSTRAPTLPGPWSSCQVFLMAFLSPCRQFQRYIFIQAFHSRLCIICIMWDI